jgi:D-3-phosphoglycerate dehydrogenase
MAKPIVLAPEKIAACGLELLRANCQVESSPQHLERADAVLVRLFEVRSKELARASRLKVIAKHGVGVDNIDVAAATARRIPVVFTPAANANAVAEHAVALMLALARQIAPAAQALRDGRFADRNKFEGVELAGKTLGVLGLGRIGSRVAQVASAGLGMRVLGYDPMIRPGTYEGPATLDDSLDALWPQCDVITLHVPLSPQTRHLLGRATLAKLKRGCRVVNTSRGAVIDEAALAEALHAGHLGGAALDVFETEPLPTDHPLCTAPNTLLTPHISSSTVESLDRMATDAAQGIIDVLQGRRPRYLVNPEAIA